jgi:hypothetical protein
VYKGEQREKAGVRQYVAPMINLEGPIMDEGDRTMDPFLTDRHAMSADIQPAGAFPSSAPAGEWGMSCPKCHGQKATPFMSWTISGRKMTVPQLQMWACVNPACLHQWPNESR